MIDTIQKLYEADIKVALIKRGSKIMDFFNECCPIKTKITSSKHQIKPLINQSIENYIIERYKNYKLDKQMLISSFVSPSTII